MAGLAKTDKFLLATATMMLGPQADLFNLNPDAHSIGLVKNVQANAEPAYTELSQGVKNTIVASVLTSLPVRISCEVYEYSPKNLAYGLGLDSSSAGLVTDPAQDVLAASVAAAATTCIIASVTDNSADWPVGAWVAMQAVDGAGDALHIAKLTGSAYDAMEDELTLTFAGHAVPAGVSFAAADKIWRVSNVDIGSKKDQPFFSAKIVSKLPNGGEPVALLFPKVRVTKGFSLGFQSDNFANMPFEITPYELVSTDANYAEFKDKGVGRIVV